VDLAEDEVDHAVEEVALVGHALIGIADLDTGWGMIFLVPGGLFELILPLLLLVKGFSVDRAVGAA
jgi:hypothetical protein